MHLVFSNIISEKRLWNNPDVIRDEKRNRASMAASTLQSMASLGVRSADIYLEFDETTEWSKANLLQLVRELPFEVNYFDYRLDSFDRWQRASVKLGRDDYRQLLIFTNEDHLLLPGSEAELLYIANLQNEAQKQDPESTIMVPLSHFPETHALIPLAKLSGQLVMFEKAPLIPCQIPGGPILITQVKFQKLWETDFTLGDKFVGLENPFGKSLRLTNGLYIPPRVELFRHFDSYGHVRLNTWPYNPIEPNIQITSDGPSGRRDFEYSISSSITSPSGSLLQTLASESAGTMDNSSNLRMSILKAGIGRPSYFSAKWVGTFHTASRAEVLRCLFDVARQSAGFRKSAIRRMIHFPGHLLLGAFGRIVSRVPSINLEFTWFLTYGSGVGFFRLLKLSWPNLRKKLPLVRH